MNYRVAQKWIKALRSGEYKQTRKALRDENGYCCLGVLCDISGVGTWSKINDLICTQQYMNSSTILPEQVRDYAGLQSQTGMFPRQDNLPNSVTLAELNDNTGFDFNKIADFIEEHWADL